MKAVIMAGGEGTRLRPLTVNRPKPMVVLVDRQAIHHIIELLKIHGITEIVITVQYLANVIQDYYGDGSSYGVNINYSLEEIPLGTAGSVKNAAHLLQEPFLVISGDALTDINLTQIIQKHRASNAMATLTLTRVVNPLEYGVVVTDEQGYVQYFLEKPSWGDVCSDTVNTGIYLLNPEIFSYIEPGKVVDWSRDVFPRLLQNEIKILGHIAQGYWTDIGTIEEYMRSCYDYLEGKVQLPRVGNHLGSGIWVDNDVEISPEAHLYGPIFLGHGVKIKAGALIQGPSFIRDYTIIESNATIDRSLIGRNSYIGERAELRGAIVSRQCDIRSRAVLFEGVVVSDGVQIGSGAVIQPGVKIWPSKEIDEGVTVTTSLIWGSQARRVLFGRQGVRGLVNVEITPEFCARLGAAYGANLPRGKAVTINRDPHYTPQMLKRALIAGLTSAGIQVFDITTFPIPVARYFTAACDAIGGVHVRLSPTDQRMAEVKFFDERGLDLSTQVERKIESIFFREDYRRVYLDEIGRISYSRNVEKIYVEAFLRALRSDALDQIKRSRETNRHPYLVIDYANANASTILPSILRFLEVDVVELNANLDENRIVQASDQVKMGLHRLTQITPVLEARMGVRIDGGGERISLVDNKGQVIPGMKALAALAALALKANNGGTVAVPVTAPRAFEEIAALYGGKILRTKATLGALMQTAAEHPELVLLGDSQGNYIFPSFQPVADGLFAVVKTMELLTLNETTLSEVVAKLPSYYLSETKVPCRWEYKGKVMRMLSQRYQDRRLEQVDGIKIDLGNDWVLILPDPDAPFFHVIAEGQNEDQAQLLIEKYAALVTGLQ